MIGSRDRVLVLAALFLGACVSTGETAGPNGSGGGGTGGTPSTGTGGAAVPASTGGTTVPAGSGGMTATGGSASSTGGSSSSTGGSPGSGGSGLATGGTSAGGAKPGTGGGASGGATVIPTGGTSGSTTLTDPGTEGDGDFIITTYPTSPELATGASPAGKEFRFNHTGSKLYPATPSRGLTVYVPAKYKDGTAAPVMIVHDGAGSQYLRVKAALDNLSQSADPARRIPAFVLIAVANGQRSLELDTMSNLMARYIDEEVFPAVLANAAVKAAYPNLSFTKDPEGRGAIGCSSGGSGAIAMAWFAPEKFRRVIGYDASIVDLQAAGTPEKAMYPFGAWEYHSDLELIKNSAVKPLRIMFDDNELDNGAGTGEAGHKDWPLAGMRMAAALKAKGYHYRFLSGKGAKHCSDARVQETSMADSLVWVWRGYPVGP
jgi:iron(III)-enterobactin esterase